jgi:hypothetical protein
LPVSGGDVFLRQEEYFRIHQVTEAFLAFLHGQPFPDYIQWRDVTDELNAKQVQRPRDKSAPGGPEAPQIT